MNHWTGQSAAGDIQFQSSADASFGPPISLIVARGPPNGVTFPDEFPQTSTTLRMAVSIEAESTRKAVGQLPLLRTTRDLPSTRHSDAMSASKDGSTERKTRSRPRRPSRSPNLAGQKRRLRVPLYTRRRWHRRSPGNRRKDEASGGTRMNVGRDIRWDGRRDHG